MAIINQSNILNLQPGITAPVVVHMSEGDVGTKLSFKLIDGANAWTDPGNVVAAVHGRRQDGTQFGPYACLISGDVVSFQTDAAMAGAVGSGIAEIVLTDSDQNTAGSANFAIMVERATFPMGVTYRNDVSVYEAILAYSQTIPAQVTENLTAKIDAEAAAREAADAELSAMDTSLLNQISNEIADRAQQDSVLSGRIDQFARLPDGSLSTAADAELADIRVQADGKIAATAGDAVREQITTLTNNFKFLADESMAPVLLLPEVTGTRRVRVETSIPAGSYRLAIADIVSSDTDSDQSSIYFNYSTGTTKHINLPRGEAIEMPIEFGNTVASIDFYAGGSDTSQSSGDTLTYTNVRFYKSLADTTLTRANVPADSAAVGGLIQVASAMGDGLNEADSTVIPLSTPAGYCTSEASGFTIVKMGNTFLIDGEITYGYTRIPLMGTDLSWTSSLPTYERRPNWYADEIPGFVLGHRYKAEYTTDGETTAATPMFTMRTKDASYNQSYNVGEEFVCTTKPQMICIALRPGTYTNYRLSVTIRDLTAEEGVYNVPEFFETQLDTKIPKILTDINSTKTAGTSGTDIETFVFITDIHWSSNKQHSPGLIKRILDKTPVSTVICGGDIIQSYAATKEAACSEINGFVDAITQIPCYEYFSVFGNHDDNSNSNTDITIQMTKEEQYNLMYMPFAHAGNVHWIWQDDPTILTEDPVKNDYYVDHARTRTRFLCLDWTNPVSEKRIAWVQSVLSREDGFRVVVIYHGFYSGSTSTPVAEHTQFLPVFEPYKGKIAAMFTGHAHLDEVMDYYGDGSTPIIITSCDTFRSASMTAGTTDEQCFDVVVIDYTNSKIELTRIGRGSDRSVTFSLT